MNVFASDAYSPVMAPRMPWETVTATACADGWLRATRRQVNDLRDEQGHRFPLRADLWVNLLPPRGGRPWRIESDAIGQAVVGRGDTDERAYQDWRKRMQATIERFLEMRPFEMTDEDQELWRRIQKVIDIARYKSRKPIVVRQAGKITKKRTGVLMVEWEDGSYEKVDPIVFDESFMKYAVGQWFEATISRHPASYRILRADAVRKLRKPSMVSEEEAASLWGEVTSISETSESAEATDKFWLGAASDGSIVR